MNPQSTQPDHQAPTEEQPDTLTEPAYTPENPPAIQSPSPIVTPTPVVPAAPTIPPPQPAIAPTEDKPVSPGIIVLQWLTYAFWGWTLLALSVLIFIVIFNLINHTDSGDTSLYALAAIVVLLPISLVCDFLYQKHELKKKQGVSMAVMVVHAVIFALFAIGTLIGSLFSVVQLIVSGGGSYSTDSNVALFLSLMIVSVLYSITFFRTLNPLKSDLKVARIYDITMLVIIGVFTVMAFTGPFARTLQTKNDRLIESSLSDIQTGIDSYTSANNKLPATLSDVNFTNDDAKQLITKNLVTYKQDTPDIETGDFHYQLCVTYTAKDGSPSYDYNDYQQEEYSSYVTTTGHEAGNVCYKLKSYNMQS
ncbi:MAG: hypothetical protein ABWX90_04115 [Candidatus Saccharimonadales bacterium]